MGMAHYLFTAGEHSDVETLGVMLHVDGATARRFADRLTEARGKGGYARDMILVNIDEVVEVNLPAIQIGDVINGAEAMTLPLGSAIVRITDANGCGVGHCSALVRTESGYVGGYTVAANLPAAQFRVLHVGPAPEKA